MPISGNPGAIPDEDEYQPQLAQQQVRQAPESAPDQPMAQPEAAPQGGGPIYFRDVVRGAAPAIRDGLAGLARIFGAPRPVPGIPTEEDAARGSDGGRRLASGEGAATSDDIKAIDYSFGIDQVQADEGVKNMIRLDKTYNYYLEQGDKDKAEAVAASLLQRGAVQVRNAGMMAAAALQEFQATGDPNDLRQASRAIQMAHRLIPDGFDLQLDIDPRTKQLVATTIDSEGQANRQVVDPRAVPGLLQKALDGSAYWKAVYQVGQPTMAKEDLDARNTAAQKAADRAYTEGYDQYKYERERSDKLEDYNRKSQEWVDQQQYLEEQGRTAGERDDAQTERYYQDWNERLAAAPPEQRQQVFNEGLQYRYENTPDRRQAVADSEIAFEPGTPQAEQFEEEDVASMRNIARVVAAKNATLDGPGAMSVTAALVTSPQVKNNPNGTLNIEGFPLVFNPQLLPALNELRRKYRVAE